jgi:hypothetical protein
MKRATIALFVGLAAALVAQASTPPLGQKKEDPVATKLFAEARAARAAWHNFPGFTADVAVNFDGKIHRGTVDVKANGIVKVEIADEAARGWVKEQLASLVAHRRPGSPAEKIPCAFGDGPADHPLGRAIVMLDEDNHSSFRVKDRQILEVNRAMKDSRFTITVLENTWNQEKQYLPLCFVVNTWDLKTNQLRSSAAYHHTWQRHGAFDLPATLTVITANDGPLECRTLKLTNYKLP